jgi:hypothetical protein
VRTGKGDTGISTPAPNQIRYTKTKETRRHYSRSRTNEKGRRINKKKIGGEGRWRVDRGEMDGVKEGKEIEARLHFAGIAISGLAPGLLM